MTVPAQHPGSLPPGTAVVEVQYTRIPLFGPPRIPRTFINGHEIPRSSEPLKSFQVPAGPVTVECRDTVLFAPRRLAFVIKEGDVVRVCYEPPVGRNIPGSLTIPRFVSPPMSNSERSRYRRLVLWLFAAFGVGLALTVALNLLVGWYTS